VGQADRFVLVASASAEAPDLTRLRLYLQTIEEVLAGRRKIILDAVPAGTRRLLYLGQKRAWMLPPPETPAEKPEPQGLPKP
jgi:membrane protease subunit HflK